VDGLKSFSPTDSDPKSVQKRTHWLANELDQEAISTEDQVALTAVLSATHIHEAKMELQQVGQHLRDNYLTLQNEMLDAQRRISKLEDLVRVLTAQKTAATDSPKLAQLMEVTSAHGQTLDLSVPKGKPLVSLKSSRTSSPSPSATNSGTFDDEKPRETTEDHMRGTASAVEHSAEDDQPKLRARFEESVGLADGPPACIASDANEMNEMNKVKKHHENTLTSNDKPLPPVPVAQAFLQSGFNRNGGQYKQAPRAVDSDPSTMAHKEAVPSSTTASGTSSSSATTFGLAKPIPAAAQMPQVVSSPRPKGKTTKWKDPPIFKDDGPTSVSIPFQFSVSSPAFNASGQSSVSTEHATEMQKSTVQAPQHPDLKQAPAKIFTSNENTRQLGSIVKVLQENKKLDEDKPLQKKPEETPVFSSANAMMSMISSVAPDSGYVVSPKPAVAAASQAAVPRAPSIPSTLPTAAPTVAIRNDSSPSNDGSNSQSSFLEVPQAISKKRKSAVKLVKPETEPTPFAAASPSTTRSSIKQGKPAEASLPASITGPSTPPAQAVTRRSLSPSTVTSSSPLTPAQAPAIKITQASKAVSASVPAFAPSSFIGTASSSSTIPSSRKEVAVPESLRKQMSPHLFAMFTNNVNSS
jgi:hypothetical protein